MRSRDAFYLPPFLPASLPPSFASLPLGCVATFFHFILILSKSFSVLQDYSRSFRDSLWFWRALRIVWASRQTLQKDVCQDRSGSFRIVQDLWGCFEMPPTSVTWWSDPSPPTILSRGGLHFRLQELLSDSLGSINIAAAFFFYYEGDPLLPFLEILSRCFNTPPPPPQILHVSIARIPPPPPPPQSCILYNIMVYWWQFKRSCTCGIRGESQPPPPLQPPSSSPPLWGVRKTATSFLLLVTSSWCCVSFPLTFVSIDVAWPLLINPS